MGRAAIAVLEAILVAGCGRIRFDERPTLVQEAIATTPDSGELTVGLAVPQPGHVLVLLGANNSAFIDEVVGGGVGSWSRATASAERPNQEIWYGVTDGSEGSVTLRGSGGPLWMNVSEWAGLATPASELLVSADSRSSNTSPASAPAISVERGDLLLFAVSDGIDNEFGSPASGSWTAMTTIVVDDGFGGGYVQASWYSIAPASMVAQPTVSETANYWEAAIAGFRPNNP